jgi:protection of telomeres protein 1
VKYRTIVRVVDFFPPNIADFAVPYKPRRNSASPPSSSEDEDEDDITPETRGIKWEWRFCLLVEDDKVAPGQARDRIKLFVSGAEAEFLLKLDAVKCVFHSLIPGSKILTFYSLRKNRSMLNRLKEKLCILWGDLEEYKNGGMPDGPQKGPSQRPFTCCVKEYGVPCACQRKAALGGSDDSDDSVILGPEHNQQCLGWERRFALFGTTINEE